MWIPIWLGFLAVVSFDFASNDLFWVSYDNLGTYPLGQLEETMHVCKSCVKLSSDMNSVISTLVTRVEILVRDFQNRSSVEEGKRIKKTNEKEINDKIVTLKRMLDIIHPYKPQYCDLILSKLKVLEDVNQVSKKREELAYREIVLKREEDIFNRRLANFSARAKEVDALLQNVSKRESRLNKTAELLKEQRNKLENDTREYEENIKIYDQKKEKLDLNREHLSYIIMMVFVIIGVLFALFVFFFIRSKIDVHRPTQDSKLDVCHLSLTGERKTFFERKVRPRLEAVNIRPSIEYRVLQEPSDFNSIPKAKSFIVHWVSQRRSIFSSNWTHRGLLKALGNKPCMIMVCDQEETDALPDGEIYDATFTQIQSEPELRDAASSQSLITYRQNGPLSAAQEQVMKNWLNANTGEGAF